MGLDMYLKRVPKVDSNKELDEMLSFQGEWQDKDNEFKTHEEFVEKMKAKIPSLNEERHITKSKYFKIGWIGQEVAYWRKANSIHRWFVENVQDCRDECKPHIASKEKLEELLLTCYDVVDKENINLLPSQGGFFFGSTDYDEWYFEDVRNTIEQLEKILKETDFEKETIYYLSSW